jgi:hypothetical protein
LLTGSGSQVHRVPVIREPLKEPWNRHKSVSSSGIKICLSKILITYV